MGRGVALGGGGIGVLIIAAIACLLGADPRQFLEGLPQQTQAPTTASNSVNQPADENKQFVSVVMGSTEDAWRTILPQQARQNYRDPVLVLYDGQVSSACGYASARIAASG